MKCPICQLKLIPIQLKHIRMLRCEKCRGHLIENRRLKKIENRIDKDPESLARQIETERADDTVDDLRCPRCRDRMKKKQVGSQPRFLIDQCGNCDFVWLDGGELARIQLEHHRDPQNQELAQMRKRLKTMSPAQRAKMQRDIENLPDSDVSIDIAAGITEEIELLFFRGWLDF